MAMKNIYQALQAQNLKNILVGTTCAIDIIDTVFPPSAAQFHADIAGPIYCCPSSQIFERNKFLLLFRCIPVFHMVGQPHHCFSRLCTFQSKTKRLLP
jgi:Glycosyl hydrolases family 17